MVLLEDRNGRAIIRDPGDRGRVAAISPAESLRPQPSRASPAQSMRRGARRPPPPARSARRGARRQRGDVEAEALARDAALEADRKEPVVAPGEKGRR
jgi:hypothetical protein